MQIGTRGLTMLVTLQHIIEAQSRIATHVTNTPLLVNHDLNQRLNANIFLKAENLQLVGAFKFRGACNRLMQLNEAEKPNGVVAFSSGNHAQGIALAAKLLNINATIVMPKDAPKIKIEGTKAYGATIRLYDRKHENREEIAAQLASSSGATVVPSFDDPHIIAGQGTSGLELVDQLQEKNHKLDCLLSPCGGGGLIAGISIAVKHTFPQAQIFSVEPEGFDDHRQSLISGQRERIQDEATSLCDALLSPTPGELTWSINRNNLHAGLVVSDDEVAHAISYAYHRLKLVVEPGGAVALAALLSKKIDVQGKTVVAIVSGGNIDQDLFLRCVQRYPNP